MTDENFTIGSSKAKAAVDCAKSMTQWSAKQENERDLRRFAEWLVKGLESCLGSTATKSKSATKSATKSYLTSQKKHELMWKAFRKLSSSADTFRKRWESFISHSIRTSPCPIFYQYVTDTIFKNMTKERFPISAPRTVENLESLSYIEKKCLEICCWFYTKGHFTKSKHSNEEELLLYLDDMVQGETTCTEDWVMALNRGGLIYVTSEMYMVICAMVIELRPHLQSDLQ